MKDTQKKSQGYILHKGITNGERFIVIGTGFKTPTSNEKTGNMLQVWILLEDVEPTAAVKSGLDATTICTGCPFASGEGCYVTVHQAPLSVWRSYHRGNYPEALPKDYDALFNGRKVRFGAYGNPTLLPLSKVKAIAKASSGWTGYFHNWQQMPAAKAEAYNRFFMASTETESSYNLASNLGLRTFHASPVQPSNTVECVSDSHGISCADCQLCQGLNKRAKNVWINPHGAKVKKANAAALA